MTKSSQPQRLPRRTLAAVGLALLLTFLTLWWLSVLGGPEAFRSRYGLWAPLLSFPAHVATTITPVGEFVPFGVANGAVYGLFWGAVLNWSAWLSAALIQYRIGRGATAELGGLTALPGWFKLLPVHHPLVLICGRWLPGGGPLVDAAAGAAAVPIGRWFALAALGHLAQAFFIAGLGAGLVQLF